MIHIYSISYLFTYLFTPLFTPLKLINMLDKNFRKGDAKTDVFGSDAMLRPAPVDKIPDGPTLPEVAYQMVKDETFAQTQPRLNLATFVTTYMDDYATKLMNEAVRFDPRFEKGLMLIALELLFTLYEAENTFVDEDPEGK